MIDKISSFTIYEPRFKDVKGHTKIELTDVYTKAKKVVESDNVFQADVLAQYMRSMGAFNNNPYANATWTANNAWQNLVGGILLFRDTIPEGKHYMPAGNQMTANGSFNVIGNGTPPEMGSYNNNESVTTGSDSLTFVYDWSTDQGNGKIQCVCLTSDTGGYIGYGNPSGTVANNKYSFFRNQSSNNAISCSSNEMAILINNNQYTIDVDTKQKKVIFHKKYIPMDCMSLFANKAKDAEYQYTGDIDGDTFYLKQDGDYIYIFGGTVRVSPQQNYAFLRYHLITNKIESITITNNTQYTLNIEPKNQQRILSVIDGNLWVRIVEKNNTMAVININTSEVIRDDVNFCAYQYVYGENIYITKICSDLILNNNPTGSSTKEPIIIDMINHTQYPINQYISDEFGYVDDDLISSYGINNMKIYKNPLYLATINNLQEAVEKDNTQTMKVTYTLTEV